MSEVFWCERPPAQGMMAGPRAVLPGCSGMSELTESLSRTAGVVVIGGVVVAGKPAKAQVGSRLPASKANT